ncbi:MAG: hypothetical protein EOP35_03290 [Rubrivivax sp.]|nr:MAG: hypothetical protein EOP35_03290 [Rubrivivax sp.]
MRRRQWTAGAGSALLFPLFAGLALPAWARDGDDGEFVILHARYGTERNHADVTARLKDLARQDRRFRLENDLFGVDPDPGRTKTLRIFARDRQGREQTFEYRERDWVDGSQFIGWAAGGWGDYDGPRNWHAGDRREEDRRDGRGDGRDSGEYTIRYATYGASGRDVDVTDRLRALARRDQRVRLTNDLFGVDPLPGQTKILRIFTTDRGGQERVFEYREYGTIDGSQFIGWGRGDWGGQRPPPGRLIVDSARYGSDGRWNDVTQALRAQLRGDRFEVEVRNELFGVDPAPGRRKTLEVTYRFDNGRSRTVRVNEGDMLRLP